MRKFIPIKDLKKKIKLLEKVCKNSSVLPILDCIYFNNSNAYATMLSLSIGIPFEFDGESCVVRFKPLKKILAQFKIGAFAFANDGKNFTIESEQGLKISIKILDEVGDYPNLNMFFDKEKFSARMNFSSDYAKAIVACSDFMSDDMLRPAMCGVYCEAEAVTATDAICLMSRKVEYDSKIGLLVNGGMIFDSEVLQLIKIKVESFTIALHAEKKCYIGEYDDGVMFSFRINENRFPDYRQVIPKFDERPIKVKVATARLIEAIKYGLFAVDNATKYFKFIAQGNTLTLKSENGFEFEYENSIEAEIFGGEVETMFRYDYLLRVLKHSEEVTTFHFAETIKSVLVNEDILLMPVLINK